MGYKTGRIGFPDLQYLNIDSLAILEDNREAIIINSKFFQMEVL